VHKHVCYLVEKIESALASTNVQDSRTRDQTDSALYYVCYDGIAALFVARWLYKTKQLYCVNLIHLTWSFRILNIVLGLNTKEVTRVWLSISFAYDFYSALLLGQVVRFNKWLRLCAYCTSIIRQSSRKKMSLLYIGEIRTLAVLFSGVVVWKFVFFLMNSWL
jgi:hypothetical protein